MKYQLFASESVCAGHPDKLCDQISDAIVDAVLAVDPQGRVAVEAMACRDRLILAGEVTTHAAIDYREIARAEIRRLGYTDPAWEFSDRSPIDVHIHQQSPEIARGTRKGAGDQGMMFGFACRETPQLMPLPIMLAHALTRAIDEARESGLLSFLRPDGKAQVVVRYNGSGPVAIEHVTLAVPHDKSVDLRAVKAALYEYIVRPVLADYGYAIGPSAVVVNGTGVWHSPGPARDAGLTGRKIVVDTYGGYTPVGGGAFSGKDPSKVDRSGAYAARYLAKNIVAAGLAERAEVALAYYIGAERAVLRAIKTDNAKISRRQLETFADQLLDTSPQGIIKTLQLQRPVYKATAAYGHFGRPEFAWERTDAGIKLASQVQ